MMTITLPFIDQPSYHTFTSQNLRCWWQVCQACQESPVHVGECRILAACTQVSLAMLQTTMITHFGFRIIYESKRIPHIKNDKRVYPIFKKAQNNKNAIPAFQHPDGSLPTSFLLALRLLLLRLTMYKDFIDFAFDIHIRNTEHVVSID